MSYTLGLGTTRLGREWGVPPKQPPTDEEAQAFLQHAFDRGVAFVDTAPAYGMSEQRIGAFIKQLPLLRRDNITVATKVGEVFRPGMSAPVVDHSKEAMMESLLQSQRDLGEIEMLQLHQATADNVSSVAVREVFNFAATELGLGGIHRFGFSATNLETVQAAAEQPMMTSMQIPFNTASEHMRPAFGVAADQGWQVIVNRPMQRGAVLSEFGEAGSSVTETIDRFRAIEDSYRFIIDAALEANVEDLVILTGTANPDHLDHNIPAFFGALNS